MTITQFLEAIRGAFETNKALQEWCMATFSKAPKILLGFNEENLPPDSDYPLIAIFGAERQRGEDSNKTIFVAEVGFGVYNADVTPNSETNSETQDGLLQVEEFRAYGEEAVLAAIKGKVNTNGQTKSGNFYPKFRSNTLIMYEEPRSLEGRYGR